MTAKSSLRRQPAWACGDPRKQISRKAGIIDPPKVNVIYRAAAYVLKWPSRYSISFFVSRYVSIYSLQDTRFAKSCISFLFKQRIAEVDLASDTNDQTTSIVEWRCASVNEISHVHRGIARSFTMVCNHNDVEVTSRLLFRFTPCQYIRSMLSNKDLMLKLRRTCIAL
jgi:hypothetical protein